MLPVMYSALCPTPVPGSAGNQTPWYSCQAKPPLLQM